MTFRQATVQELRDTFPWASEDFIQNNASDGAVDTAKAPTMHVQPIKKRSKYNVSPSADRTYNGITYDSKKEMNYYINVLEPLLKAGELDIVRYHTDWIVGNDPLTIYECDFETLVKLPDWPKGWNIEVIEVKGAWTAVARKKIKLFRKRYPLINLVIV